MFRKFKLGTKIFGSFAFVLVLLIALAGFNFYELTGITSRVALTDSINSLVLKIFSARQQEKNFIIRGEPSYRDQVDTEMRRFADQAVAIQKTYQKQNIHPQIDQIRTKAASYTKAFQEYCQLDERKENVLTEMNRKADVALNITASIRDFQKKQLESIRQKNQALFVTKLALAEEANQINNTAIEGKAYRLVILNHDDLSRMVEWEGNNKNLKNQVIHLKSKLTDPSNITLADNILAQNDQYMQAVQRYIEMKSDENLDQMIKKTNSFMYAVSSLQFDLKEQLEFLQEDTQVLIDEKLAVAEDADRIARGFREARIKEKDFVFSRDVKYFQMADELMQDIITLAETSKTKPENREEQKQFEDILAAFRDYRHAFQEYAGLVEQQKTADQQMVQDALAVETACGAERDNQNLIMNRQINHANLFMIGGTILAVLAGTVFAFLITRAVAGPVRNLAQEARRLAEGDIEMSSNEQDFIRKITARNDEVGDIGKAFSQLIEYLQEKVIAAGQIADGNLAVEIRPPSRKDRLGIALQKMLTSLNDVITRLYHAADQVDAGSSQVSISSQSLASGATQQASSIEQISASMTEVKNQTKTNAENASQADKLVSDARHASEKGVRRMETMLNAIGAISDASQKIETIIKTIDTIAFQTNLLALNAAVEAARAGKHGKGFSVVAQEVRNLAARSGKAAQETTELIQTTVQKVNDGNQTVRDTASALSEINQSITKAASLIKEIAQASADQAQGISQITQGLLQVDDVVQQNTASAEETSAEARELSSQAGAVRSLLTRFALKEHRQEWKSNPRRLT